MDNRVKELFERYLSGTASKEEAELVEKWFNNYNEDQDALAGRNPGDEYFRQIDEHINLMLPEKHKVYTFNKYWLPAAAMVLIATGFVLLKLKRDGNRRAPALTYTDLSAPYGVKKQFFLPDSTSVYLNSGSSIRIASDYGEKKREVLLKGEAYFQVQHNAAKPFVIKSGQLLITDVGTSFNVSAYPESKQIKVAVESGIVKIQGINNRNKTVLLAKAIKLNNEFVYDNQTHEHILRHYNAANAIAWRKNSLQFDNASFTEIVQTLERWYNVKIDVAPSPDECRRYTISFDNEPIGHVLKVLHDLSGMRYEITDKNISINLKNCGKS